MRRSKRWKIERDPGFCLKVGNGREKKKKKTETNMTLLDTVARERVSEISWVTRSYRNIILAQIKAQLGTVGEKSRIKDS